MGTASTSNAARRCCAWLLLALTAWLAPAAQACTATTTGGGLPGVTSQRVYSGSAITTSGSFNFTCGAVVLSVIGTPTLTGTLQTNVTGLTLKNGAGSSIPYQLYSNAGMSTNFTSGAVVVTLNGTTLLGVLNGAGNTVPFYISTTPGANIPAGTYTDTIQVTWTYANICEGLLGLAGICVGTPNNGTSVSSIVLTLVVNNDCTITAPQVSFGTAPVVSAFGTVSQNVSLVCTKGMTYTVGMNTGLYPNGSRRQMASGTNRLQYDIFKADTTVWGSTVPAQRANGPAPADGISTQTIPYTARIYTDQTTPATGTYTDSVVVDVSF